MPFPVRAGMNRAEIGYRDHLDNVPRQVGDLGGAQCVLFLLKYVSVIVDHAPLGRQSQFILSAIEAGDVGWRAGRLFAISGAKCALMLGQKLALAAKVCWGEIQFGSHFQVSYLVQRADPAGMNQSAARD